MIAPSTINALMTGGSTAAPALAPLASASLPNGASGTAGAQSAVAGGGLESLFARILNAQENGLSAKAALTEAGLQPNGKGFFSSGAAANIPVGDIINSALRIAQGEAQRSEADSESPDAIANSPVMAEALSYVLLPAAGGIQTAGLTIGEIDADGPPVSALPGQTSQGDLANGAPLNITENGETAVPRTVPTAHHDQPAPPAGKANALPQAIADFLDTLPPEERARLGEALRQIVHTAQTSAQTASGTAPGTVDAPLGQSQAQTAAHFLAKERTAPDKGANILNPSATATREAGAPGDPSASPARDKGVFLQIQQATRPSALPQLLTADTAASAFAASQAGSASAANTVLPANTKEGALREGTTPLVPLPAAPAPAATITLPSDPVETPGAMQSVVGTSFQPGEADHPETLMGRTGQAPHTHTHQPLPSQVAVQVTKAVEQGLHRFVIQLQPADLGKIDVNLDMADDGTVHAVLRAEKPETLHLLERDARLLQQALENAGLKPDSGSLSFSLKQQGNHFDDSGHHRPTGQTNGSSVSDDSSMELTQSDFHRRHDGTIDISI